MSASPRFPTDQEDDIPREMLELGRRIATLPDPHYDRLVDPYAQVVDCFKRRKRILTLVQEALSQLRLDIKYLMFDLEVTRKERDQLKAQLEQSERDEPGNWQ
jgi:hypothetical protein